MSNDYVNLILIPITMGLLEVIKKAHIVSEKHIPIVSVVLGLLFGVVFSGFEVKEGIIVGLSIGLSAVGLYSGGKNVLEGITKK